METVSPDRAENGSKTDAAVKPVDLSFLTSSPAARQLRVGVDTSAHTKYAPLTTNTTFILSQLPALHATLENLRPKLASLPGSSQGLTSRTQRDERREYIESRIRLHLERAGQLAVSDNGNPVVAGRRIDISEAQALESVASMLTPTRKD